MKNTQSRLKNSFQGFLLVLGLFGMLVLQSCGGISPPAGIPAPVAELMSVSSPDSSGTSQITGAPGAVSPGANVSANNLELMAKSKGSWFLKMANAAVGAIQDATIAAPDGSFQLKIQSQIGQNIEITQTLGQETSRPTVLTNSGRVLSLGDTVQEIVTDPQTDTVYISGHKTSSVAIFALNYGNQTPSVSLPQPTFEIAGLNSVNALGFNSNADRLVLTSEAANQVVNISTLDEGAPETFALPAPQGLSILPEDNFSVIGLNDPDSAIDFYNSEINSNLCLTPLIDPIPPVATHKNTVLVETRKDENGNIQIVSLSQFEDKTWVLIRQTFNSCKQITLIDEILLPADLSPAALATFSNTDKVIVPDSSKNIAYIVSFNDNNVLPLTVGQNPSDVVVNADQSRAYIVNQGDNSLTSVNLESYATRTKTGVGLRPSRLALLSSERQAVVLSTYDQAAVLVDLSF